MTAGEIITAVGVSLAGAWIWSRFSKRETTASSTMVSETQTVASGPPTTTGIAPGSNPTYTSTGDTPDIPSMSGSPGNNSPYGDAQNLTVLNHPSIQGGTAIAVGKIQIVKCPASNMKAIGSAPPQPPAGARR